MQRGTPGPGGGKAWSRSRWCGRGRAWPSRASRRPRNGQRVNPGPAKPPRKGAPPTGQVSVPRPAVPRKAASLGTHGSLGAEAGGRVERKKMTFSTSSEPDTGRGHAGDLWISCFHQYCIRRAADSLPSAGPGLPVRRGLAGGSGSQGGGPACPLSTTAGGARGRAGRRGPEGWEGRLHRQASPAWGVLSGGDAALYPGATPRRPPGPGETAGSLTWAGLQNPGGSGERPEPPPP